MSDMDVSKLRIDGDWLVYETGEHNCAGDTLESNYAHERGCGLEPVIRLEELADVLQAHAAAQVAPPSCCGHAVPTHTRVGCEACSCAARTEAEPW